MSTTGTMQVLPTLDQAVFAAKSLPNFTKLTVPIIKEGSGFTWLTFQPGADLSGLKGKEVVAFFREGEPVSTITIGGRQLELDTSSLK